MKKKRIDLEELEGKYCNNIPDKIVFPNKDEDIFELGEPPSEDEGVMAQVLYNARKILLERYLNFDRPVYTEDEKIKAIAIIEKIQQSHIDKFTLAGHSALFDSNKHLSIETAAYQDAINILDYQCINIEDGTVDESLLVKYFQEIDFKSYLFNLAPDTYVQIILTLILFVVSIRIQKNQGLTSDKINNKNYNKIEKRLDKIEKKLEAALTKKK